MNTFTRKSLYAALAGVSALGVTGAAQAVNVNPNGLGQVLLYPYYTVRTDNLGNPYNSLLSVVNSTNSVKAVKVRFIEGVDSQEVLDFNLFLSPNDVWVTAITPNAAGGGHISLSDKSCTLPPIPTAGVDFVNFQYAAGNSDGGTDSLDRSKEGYIEIIEMATYLPGSTTAIAATHVSGTPPCVGGGLSDATASTEAQAPGGGLFGGISLINVLSGTDYTEDAVALDNFSDTKIYSQSGFITPNLLLSSPPTSQVLSGSKVYTSTWNIFTAPPVSNLADPVSAVLMHEFIFNEFVLDSITKSGTDWVVTAPTKHYYSLPGTGLAPKLFQRNFNKTAFACDDVTLAVFDREEFTAPSSFSPPPPSQTTSLCYEATVVTFSNSHLLGSKNEVNTSTTFQDGWARIGFPLVAAAPNAHLLVNNNNGTIVTLIGGASAPVASATYFGLPVIGFAVQDFVNGTIPGAGGGLVLSSYGGNFVQKSTTRVIP